ncbi:MAG: hypothetical protein IPM56_03995 [Ignavibacteriales bacterium]|nr:MAG: hypothetical protein IPM56_03995 [Ignavibacteriales bacterium]
MLPFGFSKVPQVFDEEEELLLIQAVKDNKEIAFAKNDLDGLAEFGCLAKVSSYDYDQSFAKGVQTEFGGINQDLQSSGHAMIPMYKKLDLLECIRNKQLENQQFSDISEVEFLLLDRISVTATLDEIIINVQKDTEEKYNKNNLGKLSNIIFENIFEPLSFDCIHSLSFYALTRLMQGCSAKNDQFKKTFLKSNSENLRVKSIISLYEKGLLR